MTQENTMQIGQPFREAQVFNSNFTEEVNANEQKLGTVTSFKYRYHGTETIMTIHVLQL